MSESFLGAYEYILFYTLASKNVDWFCQCEMALHSILFRTRRKCNYSQFFFLANEGYHNLGNHKNEYYQKQEMLAKHSFRFRSHIYSAKSYRRF